MTTIKSYTDISQSKTLSKILPLESADMWWNGFVDEEYSVTWDGYPNFLSSDICTPCWSLSALLGVLHNPSLNETFSGWRCDSYNKEGTSCILGESADNPVDACVAMVEKLHEQNLL